MNKKLLTILAVVAGVFLIGAGATYASDSAAPGDLLYPLDLMVENVQRSLISDPVVEAEFEADILAERVEEFEQISEDGELEDIEEAADSVTEQGDLLKERTRTMEEECSADNCDEGEKTRVMNRIEDESADHLQIMEQTQTRVQDKYGEEECSGTCGKIDDAIESVDGTGSQNQNGK